MPLILGHRGSSLAAPENTLAAFSRAIQDGADGFEFDVRLSRDRVAVVVHDATLKRTGFKDIPVCNLTSAELQKVDVGAWFDQHARTSGLSYAGERLPTLAQVFELSNATSALLYIEIKCDSKEGSPLATAVSYGIEEFSMADRVVVASFDLSGIAEIKKRNSTIRTAALFEPRLSRPISTLRRYRMIDLALRSGADEIALHYSLAGPRVIERAKRSGLQVVLWTVDDPRWVGRARSLGIKALISNDPGVMVHTRDMLADCDISN